MAPYALFASLIRDGTIGIVQLHGSSHVASTTGLIVGTSCGVLVDCLDGNIVHGCASVQLASLRVRDLPGRISIRWTDGNKSLQLDLGFRRHMAF